MFQPVNTGRISHEIVDQVKAAIRDGRLAPGDQLPPERDLVTELGVSRVTIRDALRTLEAHGLIEVRVGARGGAFVTAPAPDRVGEGIADMLLLASVTPAEVTEARRVFELASVELACERATAEDLAALEEICDRADAALDAGTYDVAVSVEFHTRLALATHNAAFALIAETLQGAVQVSLRRAKEVDPTAGRAGSAEHRELVGALRRRDAAGARRLMAEHIERTAKRVGTAKRSDTG